MLEYSLFIGMVFRVNSDFSIDHDGDNKGAAIKGTMKRTHILLNFFIPALRRYLIETCTWPLWPTEIYPLPRINVCVCMFVLCVT